MFKHFQSYKKFFSIICRYQDEGYDDYKDKRKQKKKKSMMSLMQGDEYLDPSVAIEEGEVSVVFWYSVLRETTTISLKTYYIVYLWSGINVSTKTKQKL